MGIKTLPQPPYSPNVAPCDFWLFPKLTGCRYETIEEMKAAVTKVIDTLTRGLPWGLPEVVGTVLQVHYSRRRLLRMGLEFHVCTFNKSAHTKKVWKLIVCTSYMHQKCYLQELLERFGMKDSKPKNTPSDSDINKIWREPCELTDENSIRKLLEV